jgi:pimeloyl-ACP methyl ester carboxylesterase
MFSAPSRRNLVQFFAGLPAFGLAAGGAQAQAEVNQPMRHSSHSDPNGIYYDVLEPANETSRPPVVMVHGGGHTGLCFLATPDGRPGWAPYFVSRGYKVLVPDWPGVGRSGYVPYDQLNGEMVVERLGAIIASLGRPVILMTHSMSGPYGWKLLEQQGNNIERILAIAPGPPGNIQKPVQILSESPDNVEVQMAVKISINLKQPTVATTQLIENKLIGAGSTRFPRSSKAEYAKSLVTIPPRLLYERTNIANSQLRITDFANYKGKRLALVIGTNDPDHPVEMDKPIVDWLNQNGAKADFIFLGDRGIEGNGHMMMLESNNDEIADLLVSWLEPA